MMKASVTHKPQGFSLVEVTLALGVTAFCLLALFGLLPIGVSSNQISIEQTAAASVAASVIADLRATPVVSTAGSTTATLTPQRSKQFAIPVPPTANPSIYTLFVKDDGTMAQVAAAPPPGSNTAGWNINYGQNPRYRVTLVFSPPAAGQLSNTTVRVLVTWPAVADPTAATGLTPVANFPSRFSGSFEAVTALDRN